MEQGPYILRIHIHPESFLWTKFIYNDQVMSSNFVELVFFFSTFKCTCMPCVQRGPSVEVGPALLTHRTIPHRLNSLLM